MTFRKGKSGNPGGRPKEIAHVKELAREHTEKAIETLVEIMCDAGEKGVARVAAVKVILERGYGKPEQNIKLGDDDGEGLPIQLQVKQSRDEFISIIAGLSARQKNKRVPKKVN